MSVYPSVWMEQFVLGGRGPAEVLTPFRQTTAAATMLARVADDRTGLSARDYQTVGTARYQALILAELAHQLDDEVRRLSKETERSRASGVDVPRTMMSNLTAVVRTTATLVDVCHALLRVAECLTVVRRPKARVELAASVETLRAAIGTAQITVQTNLSRVTDAHTYDQLAEGLSSIDRIRGLADRIAETLRVQTAPLTFPGQRDLVSRPERG